MSTARQNKIDTYAAELTNIAHVSIHQEELLKGIIKCIELYKERIITKKQLDKEYKNAMRQVKYEIKIKQMKVESDYYQEVYKRNYNKTEYITISESDSITSEHPSDELLVIYDEYIYDDSLIDDIYSYEYAADIALPNYIFKHILSYFIDDDTFKVDTNIEGWLNNFVMKNVKLENGDYDRGIIKDDITNSNRFKIAVDLCPSLFNITHYASKCSTETEYSLNICHGIKGSYESYTADIKYIYCRSETSKFYRASLCNIKNIVTKYACHYRTDRDAVKYSYIENNDDIEPTIYDYITRKGIKVQYINESTKGCSVYAFKIVDDVVKTDEFRYFLSHNDNPSSQTDNAGYYINDDITTGITKYYEPGKRNNENNNEYMMRVRNTSLTCNLVKGNYYRIGIIFETYAYPTLQNIRQAQHTVEPKQVISEFIDEDD